jgi:hypothetical protein
MSRTSENRPRTRVKAKRGKSVRSNNRIETGFDPAKHAFRFPNQFVNTLISKRKIIRKVRTKGRCGGMAFTALDCFYSERSVPPLTPADFQGADVPPDGHRLADYIWSRQLDSAFKGRGLLDGWRFIRWTGRKTASLVNRTEKNEIPKIKKSIDQGDPVVLGLIGTSNIAKQGNNHQVICYAYENGSSGETVLYIYDPNEPFGHPRARRNVSVRDHRPGGVAARLEDGSHYRVTLTLSDRNSKYPYKSDRPTHPNKSEDRWRGFFVQRYRPKQLGPKIGDDPGKNDPDRPPIHKN